MKTLRSFLLLVGCVLVAGSLQATVPSLNVSVVKADGKVAYKGKTAANGTFATAVLEPGDYVVQFNARGGMKGSYEAVLSAGKQKVVSGSVPADKFTGGGVAMKIKVAKATNITGQVVTSGTNAATAANTTADGKKVKIMNGKRYVWVGPETGSNMGGRWVEEGSVTASGVIRAGADAVSGMQDRGSQGAASGR